MLNVNEIRKDFPILERKVNGKKLIYLDNAATTQKPIQVINKLSDYYKLHNSNIHRGVHCLSQESTELYENAHETVGKFVGAKNPFEETIFVRNATEGINLVMYSYGLNNLKEGDEIVSTVMEHHANIVPWQYLQKKGVKLRFVNIKEDGTLDLDDLKNKVNKKTKIVACSHASNVLGTINPIKEIGKIAHDSEALFVVDGAQAVPHIEVDVKKSDADFYAFSGHKMLAPTGTGALIGKKDIMENMEPFLFGGDMIREVKLDKSRFNDLPYKFEAGTPDIGGGIAFGEAVRYLNKIGMDAVEDHEKKLLKYSMGRLSEINDLEIYGPSASKKRSGLVSFNLKGIHSHDVGGILDSEYGVAIRTGHHCAQPLTEKLGQHSTSRASFYIYNTKQEIDVMIGGLKEIKRVFKK